jgi:hypothetical protein
MKNGGKAIVDNSPFLRKINKNATDLSPKARKTGKLSKVASLGTVKTNY